MSTASDSIISVQLDGLTADQKRAINDWLSNDESSTDEEFVTNLIEALNLTREQADLVVGYRDQAMTDLSFELFPGFNAF